MLRTKRRPGEIVHITVPTSDTPTTISVVFLGVHGLNGQLGIHAPPDVRIVRAEARKTAARAGESIPRRGSTGVTDV